MALRMIEMILPSNENLEGIKESLEDRNILGIWHQNVSEDQILLKILLGSEKTGQVLDLLEKRFSNINDFRIILLPVEATIPRPEEPEKEISEDREIQPEIEEKAPKFAGISREELYSRITEISRFSMIYVVLVILSSIVASIGILKSNIAVIVGAMVIAPLLGPNVSLAFATTLGDTDLVRKALKVNIIGIITALIVSVCFGLFFTVNPEVPELALRTRVGFGDIVLALASGSAGALSLTTGVSSALIGVMVAVALLPPLVSFGMLLGSGNLEPAIGALLLLLVNVICVNLAGVTTFFLQGIRPLRWWEAEKAKKASVIAIALWTLLLILLVIVILLSKQN